VLLELGARWGGHKSLFPVLARGVDRVTLGGALAELNVARVKTGRACRGWSPNCGQNCMWLTSDRRMCTRHWTLHRMSNRHWSLMP
jgi:hypothetical protein